MLLSYICDNFRLKGKLVSYETINTGNINTTYSVVTEDNGVRTKYIVQKINKYVFKKPELLMKNITLITNHIKKNVSGKYSAVKCLEYVKSKQGLFYFIDNSEEFWRVSKYIDGSICYLSTDDLFVIEEAGTAYGRFQKLLSDFDVKRLYVTVKNFHNTKMRFDDLAKSAKIDCCNRAKDVKNQLEYLFSNIKRAEFYHRYLDENLLPLKVTHNDTKCSNVLFDENTKKALTVIDLDTVMPGLVAYDFGDATRSMCSNQSEDCADLDLLDFNLEKFKAFTRGFLKEVGGNLTDVERNTLYMAPLVVTLELSARFLKDFIDGDLYFKCDYEKQNLYRANNQIQLSKIIERKLHQIKKIIDEN